jgi:hypothetical protein
VKLPVTLLAKWKTTLQLVALALGAGAGLLGGVRPAVTPDILGPATIIPRPDVDRRHRHPDHRRAVLAAARKALA